jgi:hypothetical protein
MRMQCEFSANCIGWRVRGQCNSSCQQACSATGALGVAVELLVCWLLATGMCAIVVHMLWASRWQYNCSCLRIQQPRAWVGSTGARDTGSALCACAVFDFHWTASLAVIPAWDATAAAAAAAMAKVVQPMWPHVCSATWCINRQSFALTS